MILKPERFPYCDANRFPDLNDVLPHLPVRLTRMHWHHDLLEQWKERYNIDQAA